MGRTRQAEAAISNLKEKEVIPKIIKNKLQLFFFSIIVFLLLLVLVFAIISPTKLTGFFTGNSKESIQDFSQEINFASNHSSTYEWKLENPGKLNSLKLSGLVELSNNSEIKIYLDELLIFDSSKIKKKSNSVSRITGEAIEENQTVETEQSQESYSEIETPLQEESSPSQEESLTENQNSQPEITNADSTNKSYSEIETPLQEESSPSQEESLTENQTTEINQETNKTIINETSQDQVNESYSEIETPLQEESSPSQEESLTENQTTENIEILSFSNICEETCDLEKLNLTNSSYTLRIELSGNPNLIIENISYEIIEEKQEIQINLTNETINTTQYPAVLGEPVKWKKLIPNPENATIKVELPKEAENISVNKVTYKKAQFNKSYSEIETPLQEESSPSQEESLTENIKKEKINPKIEKISKKERGDKKEYIEVSIEDNAELYEIEYETPAPQAIEEKLSNGKKVKVTSPDEVHYENILAYSELEENLSITDASQIQIFWVEQNTSIPFEKIEDRNLNGIYDYIEWIIPHLSNQTFLITIQPDSSKGKDTYIDEASVNRNYGSSTRLIVNAVDRRRALIEFDLSEITSTANIINANLTIYLASKGTGASIPINIYRVNNSWTEGTGNDQITNDGATWNNRTGNQSWNSTGGDFGAILWATRNVSAEDAFYTWDLTQLVQNWINGTYPNYGIMIRAGSGDGIWQFSSSEDSNSTRRPQLNITYNESVVPVINSINIPSTIREGESISLTANITDNLEVSNVSIEINNENYSLGQTLQTISNNLIIHPISKGTIETNQVINYHNVYDNNNETYAGINNLNPVLTVKTPGVSAAGKINSVKIKLIHSRAAYNTTGYVHWAISAENQGLTHEFNSTSEYIETIEFDVTSERNWTFEDFNLLTEIHINNSDNILKVYEAWFEVNYTTPVSNDLWNATINTSLFSSGNYTYTIFANDSSQNVGTSSGNLEILPPLILMNVSMNDAHGNFQESEVIIYGKDNEIEMNSTMTESQLISLEEGEKDIIIIPADTTITQIEYENATIENYTNGIIDIDHPEETGNFTTIYALNPHLETNATVSVVATGNELYKCKDWNFSEQTCFGEWIKVRDMIPGEEYNFTLNPEDPGFGEIILITKAEHLNANRTPISDIYTEIKGLDNIWSETISENEYIRITFEIPLDNTKDITLYPRIISGNPRIEVYEFNGSNLIAEFSSIEENKYNSIYLTNLIGEQSTFDLRIIEGSLELDHILDPSVWVKDLAINASLPDAGSNSTPSVFYKDSSWYILNGNLAGTFNGYVWNGTNWLVNTTINRTMVDIGANTHPSVFYISPDWYAISGMTTGRLYTYKWNGTAFETNKTMNISIPDLGSNSAPTVFYKDSSWYLISGELGGRFFGYVWNGSSFVKNLTINNSLPDIGALSKPNVFQKDGVYYMLAGESSGTFKGFAWDGTQWLPNSTINASLPDIGTFSTPSVFYKDSAWYMISGENLGRFFGYNYSSDETSPFYSSVSVNNTMAGYITLFSVNANDNYILNPDGGYIFSTNNSGSWVNDSFVNFSTTPSWANVTQILNSTVGIAVGYMWYFNDSAGNRNSTQIYILNTSEYELQCGTLDSANTIYTLTENLSSTGNCFNIASGNITLDCNGYSIIGNNNQGAKAININTPNTTIKNCIFKNWSIDLYIENTENSTIQNITGGSEYGLIVNGTINSKFTDLSFNNISITGILVTNNSHNNTFTNIRINSSAHGIYVESGQNNTFDCANGLINYSRNGSDYFYGITTNQFNTTIKNCNILDGNFASSGTERFGIYLYTSTYSTVSNCILLGNNSPTIELIEAHSSRLINNTARSGNRAIHLLDTNNTLITNNTGNSTLNNAGIHLYGTCSNNTLINNSILSRGYSLLLESNYPTKGVSNNILSNNNFTSTESTALAFSGSDNNIIINQRAESISGYVVDLGISANNTFRDCINIAGASQDITLGWDPGTFNNTLINCSYEDESIPVIENWLIAKWYYQAYVNYSNGTPVSNANITAYNSFGNIEFTAQTNSSGWISKQEVTDYNATRDGRIYYSNHTIFANKSGTISNDTNVLNISKTLNKLNDFFTLEGEGLQCGTLDSANTVYILTSNVSSTGTCFDITADNITLDCNGYWINYSIGGASNTYGVYSYEHNNLTITNCNIVDGNWTSSNEYSRVGIEFNTVTNSTIFNNTIKVNNSYGIYLYYTSNYNNLTSNTVSSNTSLGIILDDNSVHNTLINNTATSNGDAAFFIYQYSDHNTLIGNNGTSRFAGGFIYLAGNNNLSNNIFSNLIGTDYGLYLYDAYNNLLINNTAISEVGTATHLGISVNNTFIQHTSIVIGSGYHGISLDSSTNNTIIRDCINISGADEDVTSNGNSVNNTFINCSYDNTESIDDASSQLIHKWYYQAYANYTNGTAVENANISAYNTTGQLQFTTLTNSSGYISRQEITEYVNTGGTRSYYNNYTIFANKSGTTNDTNILNISTTLNKLNDFFTLEGESLQCSTLNSANTIYTLTSNVSSTGTCFTISAANITLDCNNYWINYSTNGGADTYGVYTNQFNTTIKNCNIIDGNWTSSENTRQGIYMIDTSNSTIFNNYVSTNNSETIVIYGNTFFSNVTSNRLFSNSSLGIYSNYGAADNWIVNNTVISGDAAVHIECDRFTFISNNLTSTGEGDALTLNGANNATVINNILNTPYFRALWLTGSNSNITGNIITANSVGIFIPYDSNNNYLANNTVISETNAAIAISSSSNNNTLVSNNLTGLVGYNIGNSNYTTVSDCIYTSGSLYDVEIQEESFENIFINCSYDINEESVSATGELIRKWYYQAYTNYSNGTAVAEANISAYNTTGQFQFTILTNSSGYISRQEITEYVNTGGTRSYYNNYTINATLAGYETESNIFNFTIQQNKINDVFTFDGESLQCSTLNSANTIYTLTSNVSSTGTCFDITADNITLDCNNYWINYSIGGGEYERGVDINAFNATVKNCNIVDGSMSTVSTGETREGIYVEGLNCTLFNNSITTNTTTALFVYDSSNFTNLTRNKVFSGNNAIFVYSSHNVLRDNTGNSTATTHWYCSGIRTGGDYDTLINNTAGGTGYALDISGNYGIFINNTAISTESTAILLQSDNNEFINQIAEVRGEGYNAISFASAKNNTLRDCINLSGNSADISLGWDSGSFNNKLVNCSIDEEDIPVIENWYLTKWYYQAYVNNTAGSPVSNVNISAYSSTGQLQFTALTNSSGWISRQEITDYNGTYNGRSYYNNYTINATLAGYTTDSNVFNFTTTQNKIDDVFTLNQDGVDTIPPTIIFEAPTPSNGSTLDVSTQTIVANISDVSTGNTSSWIDFDRSLRGYWSMDYYNTTGIFDNSTWNNFGSFEEGLNYSNISAGSRGDALTFNGGTNSLSVNDISNMSQQVTMSVWANTLGNGSGWNALIGHTNNWGSSGGYGLFFEYSFNEYMGGQNIRIRIGNYSDTWNENTILIDSGYSLNSWRLYTMVWDYPYLASYVNGVLVDNYTFEYTLSNTWNNFRIGDGFNGSLDEVMIFNRSLSESEILALYNSQSNLFNTTFNNLQEGKHNYTIYAIDSAGNINNSGERNFILEPDTTYPNGTINSPIGTIADVTPLINITISENSSVWYNIDNGTNITLCNNCNSSQDKFLYTEEGEHILYLFANDSVGNLNSSISSSFTINMNNNYYDSFNDNSGIRNSSNIDWNSGNVSFTGGYNYLNDPNLVSLYLFENSGNLGLDIEGNNNMTSVGDPAQNTTIPNGFTGYSIQLDGDDQVCNYSGFTFNASEDHTMCFWIMKTAFVNDGNVFAQNCVYDTWDSTSEYLFTANNCFNQESVGIEGVYFLNEWAHICQTYDATINNMTFYIDGHENTSHVFTGNPIQYHADQAWCIGGCNGGCWMTGNVFQPMWFDRMLSSEEVYSIYSNDRRYNLGNFTSYAINTTQNITQITNITWTEINTDANNNITIEVSADGGITWHTATSGSSLSETFTGENNSLVYRVLFATNGSTTIAISDMNISWSNETQVLGENACGTLDSPNTVYTLTQNVSSQGTCFNITAENVTLDCNGYWINFSLGGLNGTSGAYSNQFNTTVKNCNIVVGNQTTGQGDDGRVGIYFVGANNGTIFNNSVIIGYTSSRGIHLEGSADFNNITNNTAMVGYHAIDIQGNYTIIINNLANSSGLYYPWTTPIILYGASNSYLENNTAIGYYQGLYLGNGAKNNIFRDFPVIGGNNDIYIENTPGIINNTFINCSYDSEVIESSSGELIRKWYYQAYTNYSNGTAVAGANISAYNTTGQLQFTTLTNGTGYIGRQEIIDYVNTGGTRSYYNNYTINSTLAGYETESNIFNFTTQQNKVDDLFTFEVSIPGENSCGTLDSTGTTYILTQNVSSQGTCFTISAANVTLDCNNYWINYSINGTNSSYGVYTTQYNTTVKNCNLANGNQSYFSYYQNAIYTDNINNFTIFNNSLYCRTNTSYCLYVYSSDYGNISKNNIITQGSSVTGIYLHSSSAYNNFSWNNVNTSGSNSRAIHVQLAGKDNFLFRNKLNSTDSPSIHFQGSSDNTILLNMEIYSASLWGILIMDSNHNLSIFDSIINSTSEQDIGTGWSSVGVKGEWNFTNVTNSENEIPSLEFMSNANGVLNRMWYFDANVSYSNGTAIENANISVYDLNNNMIYTENTSAQGDINRISLLEYSNSNNTVTYPTPHVVNVTKAGYYSNSTSYNLTAIQNVFANIFLEEQIPGENACGTLDSANTVYALTQNVSSQGTCFTITQPNITLDCNSYWINYSINGTDYGRGIYTNQFNTTIKNCNIIDGNITNTNTNRQGIYFYQASNGTIENNRVTSNNSQAVHLRLNSQFNKVINNTIYGFLDIGLDIHTSNNNNITGNSITTNSSVDSALVLYQSSENTIVNNTGIGGGYGIYVVGTTSTSSNRNIFINNTATSNIGDAIRIVLGEGNTFTNQIAKSFSSGDYAVIIDDANNTRFIDCINLSSSPNQIYIHTGDSINNSFVNCSYSSEWIREGNTELIRKWYYQAYTNYSNGTAVAGANISAYNTTGQLQFTTLTNGTGYIGRQEIIDYVNTGGTRSYYNNYTINSTLAGYETESNIFNFTTQQNKVDDVFTFEVSIPGENACGTLDSANTIYTLTDNVSSQGTCFDITAENITLDCKGYWINYSMGGAANTHGISIENYNNLSIKNCNIVDGNTSTSEETRYGMNLYNTENGFFFNNSIITYTSFGINSGWDSNKNNFTSNNVYSLEKGAIQLIASNNNTLTNNNLNSDTEETITCDIEINGGEYNLIINNTVTSSNCAIGLVGGALENSFVLNNISGELYALHIAECSNNIIRDCIGFKNEIYQNYGTAQNTTIINCSQVNEQFNDVTSTLIRKWYYQAYTNYSNGTAVAGANISAYNTTGQLQFTTLTNGTGYIGRQEIIDYVNTGGTRSYYNNYTINSTLAGYETESNIFNFTTQQNKVDDVFTLELNSPPQIYSVTLVSPVTLTEGPAPTSIIVNFSVYDANGVSNLNSSTAAVNFTKPGEELRYNNSCIQYQSSGNYANYTCNVTMWWFDAEGDDWKIYANISDLDSNIAVNNTLNFTVNSLTGFVVDYSSLNFAALVAGSHNQTPVNHFKLNNTGNVDISVGNIEINATDLVGETTHNQFLFAGNFSASPYTGNKIECNLNGSSTQLSNYTFTKVENTLLPSGNYTLNDGTAQEEIYICLREIGIELTQQQYSTDSFGSWTIRVVLVALSIRTRRKKKSKSERISQLTIPATIFTKKLGALESTVKYMKEKLGLTYHTIAEMLNRDERTIWTAYKKSIEKYKEAIEVKETDIFIPLSILNNRKLTILESIIVYLRNKEMTYSEISRLIERDQRNVRSIYINLEERLKEKQTTLSQLTIPATIFTKKLGALESTVKYMKENLGMSYHNIGELLKRDERTIWTAYKKSIEKYKEAIEVKETDIFIPLSILNNRKITILESIIIYLRNKEMTYSEISRLIERDQRNVRSIYCRTNNNI